MSNINWYPGHMAKTTIEFESIIKITDFVIEIVDARIPESSRNPNIEKMIKKHKKIHIKILSKSDYVDLTDVNIWQSYYLKNKVFILYGDLTDQSKKEKLIKQIKDIVEANVNKKTSQYKRRGM